jgi:flagellar biosynthesis protein FlhF
MIVRRYHGRTEREATERACQDLGPKAVVLLTKRLDSGQSEGGVEVVAAAEVSDVRLSEDDAPAAVFPEAVSATTSAPRRPDASARRPDVGAAVPGPGRHVPAEPPADEQPNDSSLSRMRQRWGYGEYGAKSVRGARGTPRGGDGSVQHYIEERLLEQEVEPEVAQALLDGLNDVPRPASDGIMRAAHGALSKALRRVFAVSAGIRVASQPTMVAVVGPTGVGKTTTVAKLAAQYYLQERLPVTLITADTYRIAAVEQLRTYANILSLPLEIVMTPAALGQVLQKRRGRELLLLDTPGRSPQNRAQLQELRDLLAVARPDETHLLVGMQTRLRDLWDIARGFHVLEPNRLVFTKLDESTTFGNVLNFAHHTRLPLAYLTTGQTVPDDIAPVSSDRLAHLLLQSNRMRYC